MPHKTLTDVLDQLRKTWAAHAGRDLTDGELLNRYVADREEAAFTVLVQRHGPMVFSVGNRVLGDVHAAEDVFQATFMVLARRAASLGRRQPLGGWLYAVAQRIAAKARIQTAVRREHERRSVPMPQAELLDELTWQELRTVLDEEIARLPQKYRNPIVLCYFEGKSHDQAAKELGWPKNSLTRRVGRGRELLRQRLVQRGISLSAVALSTALVEKAAAAPVATLLTLNTVKAVASVLAGSAGAGVGVSQRAVALAEHAVRGMVGIKVQMALAILVLTLALGGGGWAAFQVLGEKPMPPTPEPTPAKVIPMAQKQEDDPEKLYFAMENKIKAAKSLKVVSEGETTNGPGRSAKLKGTALLSDGNKARMEIDITPTDGAAEKALLVSDGKQIVMRQMREPDLLPDPTPERFGTIASAVISRAGTFIAALWFAPGGPESRKDDITKPAAVSNFILGPKEQFGKRETRVIEYSIALKSLPGEKCQVKLWIDLKTMLPAKRQLLIGDKADDFLTEVYTEFTLDPKLDAKVFDLPPPAKVEAPGKGGADSKAKSEKAVTLDQYGDPLPAGALARLGTLRFRNGPYTRSLNFLQGGKQVVATGGNVLCLRFYDAATGQQLRQRYGIFSVVFSPDEKLFFSSFLKLHDAATGEPLRRFDDSNNYHDAIAYSPDAKTVAAGKRIDQKGAIAGVMVWEVDTGKELHRLKGHTARVLSLAYSADSKILASGSQDKTVRLWDIVVGKELQRLEGHEGAVTSVAFSPDGKFLATACGEDGQVFLWDPTTGKLVRRLKADAFAPADATLLVAFAPDGKLLACAGPSGTISLWDPAIGKEVRRWQAHADEIKGLTFTPDGKMIGSVGNGDFAIRLWDTTTGKPRNAISGHTGEVKYLRVTDDGKSLHSGSMDGRLLEWDFKTTGHFRQLSAGVLTPAEAANWQTVDFSASGKMLALTKLTAQITPKNPIIRLVDAASGKVLHTLQGHSGYRAIAKFSSDGKHLASGSNDGLRLWDTGTGQLLQHMEGALGWAFAFSPDSKLLAVGGKDKTIRLWDIATAKELRQWEAQAVATGLVFSPDGKLLAGLDEQDILVWATDTGKQQAHFSCQDPKRNQPYFRPRASMAFSPSGRVLAIGGLGYELTRQENRDDHGCIQLWDAYSGEKIGQFFGPQGTVDSVAFVSDGRILASGGGDSTILLYNLTSQDKGNKSKPVPMTAVEIDSLWNDLAADAAKADRAIWALAGVPKQAVPMLSERLRPVVSADAKQVAKLVTDLDSDNFAVRQKAIQGLADFGEAAEGGLRKVLEGTPTLEVRQRLEQILEKRNNDPEQIRRLRAIEVLEHVGTAEAREALEVVAKGAPHPRVAHAAMAALGRLGKR